MLGAVPVTHMPDVLRFIQTYRPGDREAFMNLEAEFAALERHREDLPKGRRSQPCCGTRPSNTLVWESRFESLADIERALAALSSDPDHAALFARQVPYIVDATTEIDQVLVI